MLPIDANVLMDLIDIICGSLILRRNNGNLHNVTLPLSVFNNLVRVVKIDLHVKPSNISAEINAFLLSLKYLLNSFVTHQQRLGRQFLKNFRLVGYSTDQSTTRSSPP
jgi:hypothetical protein